MIGKIYLFIIAAICTLSSYAQADSSHLRISLLTCGVGEEIWEIFGHTGVRVIDSTKHTDIVYNYGTFDGFDKDFEIKFMRGKLLYYVSVDQFNGFMQEYVYLNRIVEENVLQIGVKEKHEIDSFLKWNAMEENKYYKYDFYFDNCATRIRDIFPRVLGKGFKFGQALPLGAKITFRNITDQYLARRHWERFGINMLLGSKVDKAMSNEDIMFLPDYLRDGIATATVDGKGIASDTKLVLHGEPSKAAGLNEPFILTCLLALLTIIGLSFPRLKILGKIMSFLMLFISGLLGCLMLFMWLGTNHQACGDNFNILWALPTNFILAFLPKRNKSRYVMVAVVLLLVSLLLHVFKVQELPLLQLGPILLSLLYVYGIMYRNSSVNAAK